MKWSIAEELVCAGPSLILLLHQNISTTAATQLTPTISFPLSSSSIFF
jgi:hypothetical protein